MLCILLEGKCPTSAWRVKCSKLVPLVVFVACLYREEFVRPPTLFRKNEIIESVLTNLGIWEAGFAAICHIVSSTRDATVNT